MTKCGIHILAAAKARNAAKDFAVLSKRVAELLEPVEHAFDTVAVLVDLEVALWRVLAVGFWWDHRKNAAQQQILADGIAIIAFVGQEQKAGTTT